MEQRISTLAVTVAMLAGALPAAAMIVTASPSPPPAAEVLLAYDTAVDAGGYLCSHGSAAAVDVGQTFRLTQPATLDKITLKVRALSDVRGELVTLLLGTFTDPDDPSMNEILAAETRGLPSTLAIGETLYLTFDVEDMALEAERQYGFLLGFTGGGNVNDARLEVLHLGADGYAGGQAIDAEEAFTSALEHDLVFFLHGDAPAPAAALMLHDGRFRVEAEWRTFAGDAGSGVPVGLTDESGYFWFFAADNVEIVLKVLDACVDPWNRFWVFAAGLTNVEVTLTVSDARSGERWIHTQPMGEAFAPVLDLDAFATCGR